MPFAHAPIAGTVGPLGGEQGVDRGVAPRTLEPHVLDEMSFLPHAEPFAEPGRRAVPRIDLGPGPVHAQVAEGKHEELSRRLGGEPPSVILRVERPADLRLPVGQLPGPDHDIADHAAVVLNGEDDSVVVCRDLRGAEPTGRAGAVACSTAGLQAATGPCRRVACTARHAGSTGRWPGPCRRPCPVWRPGCRSLGRGGWTGCPWPAARPYPPTRSPRSPGPSCAPARLACPAAASRPGRPRPARPRAPASRCPASAAARRTGRRSTAPSPPR